jgi:hypothetical protein
MAEGDNNGSGPRARAGASPQTTPHSGPGISGQSRDPPRSLTDSLITGVLLKHGHAPFEFKAQGVPSYFVTVQTERGERTLWGRGLERALTESRTQPRPGEAVGIRENGIDPMVVVMRERDAQGQVRLEKRLETPRGHWVIERREFFDERSLAAQALRDPRVSRREAVRNHPELVGAYWALDSAGKVAEARIGNPESRQRFVALVREALAHAAERGEPLPSARQHAQSDPNSQTTKDRGPQRDADRTR